MYTHTHAHTHTQICTCTRTTRALSLSPIYYLSIYLPTYLPIYIFVYINLCIHLSPTYLHIYLPTTYPSTYPYTPVQPLSPSTLPPIALLLLLRLHRMPAGRAQHSSGVLRLCARASAHKRRHRGTRHGAVGQGLSLSLSISLSLCIHREACHACVCGMSHISMCHESHMNGQGICK